MVLSAGTQTLSVTFTPTDTNTYETTTESLPITVNPATLTATAANASRVYGTANPAFTGTVTGAVNGDSLALTETTSATASSNAGSYAIVPGVTGAHVSDYTVIPKDGTLTITQAASATILTTSNANASLNENVTFTATTTSATTGSPAGEVEFLDGSTALGTSVLNAQGVATQTISSLTAGAHTITAIYAGNQNFLGAENTVAEQVTAPAFAVTVDSTTLTLRPGETGVLHVTFAPAGGYSGTVTYACVGLPQGAACSFAPPNDTADGSNKPLTTTLTVTTQGSNQGTVALERVQWLPSETVPAGFWFVPADVLGILLLWQRRKLSLKTKQMLMILILLAGAMGAIGCSYGPETPQGSSTVKVTATGTNHVTQSTSFTLTVMQ